MDHQNNVANLQSMVKSFRVHELQMLLTFASKSKCGKKQDLLLRAIDLVSNTRSLPVQMKVQELHRKRWPENNGPRPQLSPPINADPPARVGSNSSSGSDAGRLQQGMFAEQMRQHNLGIARGATAHHSMHTAGGYHDINSLSNNPASMVQVQAANAANMSIYPKTRFSKLPFYDHIGDLMRPTTLVARTPQKFQENMFHFVLKPDNVRDISYMDDLEPLPRYEIQLRFCLYNQEFNIEQKDDFPSGCVVKLNDKMVTLPNPIPSNKPGVEPKRPSRPVDITPYIARIDNRQQRLSVSWGADPQRNWVVYVREVRRVDSKTLMDRLKKREKLSLRETQQLIQDKLQEDDADLAATSFQVSLLCPLGKMRMNMPAKVRECEHIQCFDASNYLEMNERKPTWFCPVCDKPGHFDLIVVDEYIAKVLRESPEEVQDIEVHNDGSWTGLARDDENKLTVACRGEALPGSSETTKSNIYKKSPNKRGSSPIPVTLDGEKDDEYIDLISDTDDDDDNNPQPVSTVIKANHQHNKQQVKTIVSKVQSISPAPNTPQTSPNITTSPSRHHDQDDSIVVIDSPTQTPDDPVSTFAQPTQRGPSSSSVTDAAAPRYQYGQMAAEQRSAGSLLRKRAVLEHPIIAQPHKRAPAWNGLFNHNTASTSHDFVSAAAETVPSVASGLDWRDLARQHQVAMNEALQNNLLMGFAGNFDMGTAAAAMIQHQQQQQQQPQSFTSALSVPQNPMNINPFMSTVNPYFAGAGQLQSSSAGSSGVVSAESPVVTSSNFFDSQFMSTAPNMMTAATAGSTGQWSNQQFSLSSDLPIDVLERRAQSNLNDFLSNCLTEGTRNN